MHEISAVDICRLISETRLSLSHEKETQAELAAALDAAGIAYEREKRLFPGDIPDFLIACGVAVEIKIKGASKAAVYRQIQRYEKHDLVKSIVLATNFSMGLPTEIEGKPAYYASLGRAWL